MTSGNGFVDFKSLIGNQETHRIVSVKAWADAEHPDGRKVRINKLTALQTWELVDFQDDLKDDEGEWKGHNERLTWSSEVLARTLASSEGAAMFDTEEGRAFLKDDFRAQSELLPQAMELSGLGSAQEVDSEEEAKAFESAEEEKKSE